MQVAGLQAATAYDVYLLPAAASASRRRRLHALGSDAAFASAYATRVQVTTGAATAPTAVVSSDTGAMVSANPFNVTISWDREVCAQPRRERERDVDSARGSCGGVAGGVAAHPAARVSPSIRWRGSRGCYSVETPGTIGMVSGGS
jgi:hypothetical protein